MKRSTRLRLLELERRDVPAQFGVPWPDRQVTISFVPDGTLVDGTPSNLVESLAAANLTPSAWKGQILQSIQRWSAVANINIGLVDDDGSSIGATGRSQHDLRFGDIRISGRPLSADVIAVTVPPGPACGTRAGDIIINTAQPLNIGGGAGMYDLFTSMLQETGHALGLGNNSNQTSAMYRWYEGVRSGISTGDANDMIALYGHRPKDYFDQLNDNGTIITATPLDVPATLNVDAPTIVEAVGAISAANDADYYSFVVPNNSGGTIAVRLNTTGASLLRGKLSVFNANHDLVLDEEADSPLNGNLVDAIANVEPGERYFVRVERAAGSNSFAVGQYRMQIDFDPYVPGSAATGNNSTTPWVFDDDHSDDDIAFARQMDDNANNPGVFAVDGRFADDWDVDFYQLETSHEGVSTRLTVSISSVVSGMKPLVSLYSESFAALPLQVVRNAGGMYSVQAMVVPGEKVYLAAKADRFGALVGEYRLDATINTSVVPAQSFLGGLLPMSHPVLAATLTVHRSTELHLILSQSAASPNNNFGAQVEIRNMGGVVAQFGAASYTSASLTRVFEPGVYTIRVGGKVRTAGASLPSLTVALRGLTLSDPIGPRPENPDVPDDFDVAAVPVDWSPWDINGDIVF